jgi:hypothetical protein
MYTYMYLYMYIYVYVCLSRLIHVYIYVERDMDKPPLKDRLTNGCGADARFSYLLCQCPVLNLSVLPPLP